MLFCCSSAPLHLIKIYNVEGKYLYSFVSACGNIDMCPQALFILKCDTRRMFFYYTDSFFLLFCAVSCSWFYFYFYFYVVSKSSALKKCGKIIVCICFIFLWLQMKISNVGCNKYECYMATIHYRCGSGFMYIFGF